MYSPRNDDVLRDSQTELLVSKVHLRRAGTMKTLPPTGTSGSLCSPKRYGDKAAGARAWTWSFAYTDNRVKKCVHRHIIEREEFCGLWNPEWIIGPPYNLPLGRRTTRKILTPVFDSFGTHWPPASCLPACFYQDIPLHVCTGTLFSCSKWLVFSRLIYLGRPTWKHSIVLILRQDQVMCPVSIVGGSHTYIMYF